MRQTGHAVTGARIGADVGGTFTDVVLIDAEGRVSTRKVASSPDDFGRAVVQGVVELLGERDLSPDGVRDLVHGTTVATNAILEFKGAPTGLLTTRGFRDVLELRRLRMPRLYEIFWDKPAPLVARQHRLEIDERLDGRGGVLVPLDLAQAERAAEQLIGMGITSIAVAFLHAYANPVHERAVGEMIRARWPRLDVSLSHEVLPAIREYERTSTTVINAYVLPVVRHYLESLRRQLDRREIDAPLLIMQSNGGVMSDAAAAAKPAYIIESGPAAGVIASVDLARRLGLENVITFDMGGTTAKASLVEKAAPDFTSEFEVGAGISLASRLITGGGYALNLPVIDLSEVGAGGGSIVWIDPAGAPKVGPRSAGAAPGPVCYAQGGTEPTMTDVNVILGYINPTSLLDGTMPIDATLARDTFRRRVADPLGLDLLDAAYGAHELANASMIRAVKAVSTHRGRDPRDFTLFAFGGSGPIHVAGMARELEIGRVVIPPAPGLFSAFGLLSADLEHHAVRTFLRATDELEADELVTELEALEARGRLELGRGGFLADAVEVERWVEMRYVGQSFELAVPVGGGPFDSSAVRALRDAFDHEHERTYGHRVANRAEIVNLRVVCRAPRPSGNGVAAPPDGLDGRHLASSRPAYFGPRYGSINTAVIRRGQLAQTPTPGPLIVEEYDATVVVPPYCAAARDSLGNIVLEVRP
ncbi:MAG: hydantoinase/oxoprolinase family protein [Chloroflexi bacterium]|nr:hydantoinase/oxoprolinase family protein [Chloroflexota bacterium]